ncbi:hypothetical protein GCM10018965_093130 [Nonomuraea roseola]
MLAAMVEHDSQARPSTAKRELIDRPPGWTFLTLVTAAGVFTFWWASAPFLPVETVLFIGLVWTALMTIWWIWWIAAMAMASTTFSRARARGRWLAPPLILAAAVGVLATDAPFHVRFALSEASLEAYAQKLAQGAEPDPDCERVGLYRACKDWLGDPPPGGAMFLVTDFGVESAVGFAWSPTGQEPALAVDFEHLGGRWWATRQWDKW